MKVFALTLLLSAVVSASESGPEPYYSGAPADRNPQSCASARCHTSNQTVGGPINTFGGSVTAAFSSGNVYYPGIPVVISVSVADPANNHFGFQMTARLDSNAQAGSFTAGSDALVVICEDNRTRRTTCPTNAPLEFIEHSRANTGGWQFTWTPSANQSGPVHFYVAGNAVNFNGTNDAGDHVYTKEYVLNPAACTQVTPAVTSVSSAGDFGGFSNIAAASWVEIKGSNLANSTRIWEGRDFLGSLAPNNIDGVRVTINGKSAPVYYVSPVQLNVQAPADTQSGPVAVVVTTCGGSSAPFSATKVDRSPGVLASSPFNIGKQYMVAQFQDLAFVGRTNLFPAGSGVITRPAKPGDALTIYGVGFGDVTPTQTPGIVVSAANQTTAAVRFLFGSVEVTPAYAGLAPGFVGLYQFNLTVPNVPDGDQEVKVTSGGTATAQPAMFLTIQR